MIYGSLHFSQLLALSTCCPPDSSKCKSYFFELVTGISFHFGQEKTLRWPRFCSFNKQHIRFFPFTKQKAFKCPAIIYRQGVEVGVGN